jgi:hypothetical protein
MKNLILFLFFVASNQLLGQNFPSNSLDDIYTPPKGSIFDSKKGSSNNNSSSNLSDHKNIIGFNIGLLARSIGAINYERVLSNSFGVSANIGFTFAQDYIRALSRAYSEVKGSDYTDNQAKYQSYYSYGSSESSVNPFLQLQGKYYFDNDPFDGPYVSLLYRFYSNTLIYGGSFSNDIKFKGPTYNVNMNNIALIFGRHWTGGGNSIHDFYYGIGYRSSSIPLYNIDFKDPISGTSFEDITSITSTNKTGTFGSILILMGYSFGFSF